MPDVYIADQDHYCGLPERHSRTVGSIWQCDECCTYFAFGCTEDSWGPVWYRVRWWHWRHRRTISRLAAAAPACFRGVG